MRISHLKVNLKKLHRLVIRIARIRFVRFRLFVLSLISSKRLNIVNVGALFRRFSNFLFFKKITLARWQLNTFSVIMLSLGFVLGTYAMITELVPRLMALDETSFVLGKEADTELTAGSGTGVVISAEEVTLGRDEQWFDLGWSYKKQLSVKNLSTETLADGTPVQVTINTKELFDATKLQNDCDDLRIIRSSEGIHTELTRSFHKASGSTNCSDSTATVVTFPIQSELTSGGNSGEYYLYYNNPGASNPGFGDDGYNIGDAQATIVCPFNGTTTCVDGETPSTATGAIRYSTGSALSFDGMDDTVVGPPIKSLVGTPNASAFTVEGFFNFASIPSSPDTYIFGTNNTAPFGIGFTWAKIRLRTDSLILECSTPSLNTWTHIAVSYDGTTLRLFKNGTLCGSAVTTVVSTAESNFLIGQTNTVNGSFPMKVDAVRVSDIARYTSDFTPQTTPFESDANTKLLYHFDENGSDPRNAGKAIDASGNGNYGTITGAKYVSGIVGIDSGTASPVKGQSYASNEGIFLEEGTTNLITNPSFEHSTYNTNWGLNYFNYNSSADTFTAKMAKRNSAGPFESGVMVGGDSSVPTATDTLAVNRGNAISWDFYSNFDASTGSIVFWITPEWAGNDSQRHTILNDTDSRINLYKGSDNRLHWCFESPGCFQTSSIDISGWVAGSTHLVVVSWGKKIPIGGSNNYAYLSIDNETPVLNHTTERYNFIPGVNLYLGTSRTSTNPANAIIEGLTIYRRPLFDGQYGIDVGNGNEITQIYNSGTGKDPTLITGSWDVVFALPTNATAGELAAGTGNAWSHPHSSNLLYTNTTNTGGFMMNGIYTNDGWADEGTPTAVEVLATNEKIYAGGYKVTSDSANEGIYYQKTITQGEDIVIRALAHSDGISIPKVILYDQTNGEEIGSLTGTRSSSRTAPNALIFTGEAPDGFAKGWVTLTGQPTDLQTVTIGNKIYTFKTDISGTPGAGEIWVFIGTTYNNTADNLRRAISNAGTAGTHYKYGAGATAHTLVSATLPNAGNVQLTAVSVGPGGNAVVLAEDSDNTIVSGASLTGGKIPMSTMRIKLINTQTSGVVYWHQVEVLQNQENNPSFEEGGGDPWVPRSWENWNMKAGESSRESSVIRSGNYSFKTNSILGGTTSMILENSGVWEDSTKRRYMGYGVYAYAISGILSNTGSDYHLQSNRTSTRSTSTLNQWEHLTSVRNKRGNDWSRFVLNKNLSTASGYFDDAYSYFLNDVPLTVTPASEANSTESTGLRVDGADTLTQPVSGLSSDRGTIKFKFTPRHSFDVADKFGFANPNIIKLWYDANNQIYFYKTGTKLRIGGFFSGTEINADWTNPTLNAGTTYNFEIAYSSGGNITLTVDGVQRATTTGVVNFANIPNTAYFGTDNFGSNQYDSTISNFVALTPTENTTTPYYKFGSKSVKLVNAGSAGDEYTTTINPGSANSHTLSAYVYDGTTGNIGGAVSASITKLVFAGNIVTPTLYEDMGGGWWRLQYTATTINASRNYGVQALAGKTIYVDGVQLEAKAYSTTYADGSLGSGYSWSGGENESNATRVATNLTYTNNSDLSANSGTISFWTRPNHWQYFNGLPYRIFMQFGNFVLAYQQGTYPGNNNYWSFRIGGNSPWVTKPLDFSNNRWVHIVATWDNGSSRVYVNSIGGVVRSYTWASVGNLSFGSNADSMISDFRAFNEAISEEQIVTLYQTGLQTHTSGAENDEKYVSSGGYESDVLDLGNAGQWGLSPNFLVSEQLNGNSINYETRTSDDNLVWSDYSALTGGTPEFSIVSPPKRYLQIKANLLSTEKNSTPVFSGAQINYVRDAVPPEVNATETTLKRTISGDTILEGNYTNSQAPYFSWMPGQDDEEGSGLRGYCLYLGPDANGNPANDKGLLGSSPGSTANTTCPFVVTTASIDFANTNLRGNIWLQSSTSLYYLIIRAVDNTGNVYSEEPEIFSFKFDNTPPTNPGGLFAPAGYQREFESFIISWPTEGVNAPKDLHSTVKGFQYKLGTTGTWYGGSHSGDQDCNDVLTTNTYALDSEYDNLPSGETPFFLRTIDHACNISASAISAILKYNSVAPSAPRDLEVTPVTNDQNVFSFSWNTPEIFSGNENNITYCYTVNTIPTAGTCIFTSSKSLNPDAFATQPGENTFYIVSRDEASNINYGDYSSVKFWANTSAPGVPRNLDVADISVKSTENWRLTVSWDEPEEKGAGVAKYFVYRSLTEGANCSVNFSQFAKVGETAGGSYVDINLQQKDHYYCVRACDSTNNCSATSSTVSNFPDGKFTEPAEMISSPVVSNVSTRGAKIGWITERTSDSKISYGLASDDYFKEEVGSSQQVINHEISLTNLEPGTIYYFRAKWTDEDGNTGISDEYTFTTAPPPSVKDVTVSSVGISTAVISFTTTGSTSANLYYGGSTAFGSVKEVATSPLESRYTVLLEGLQDGTRYYFRIDSVDSEGYKYEGTVLDFATLPQPKITNVRIQQVKNAAQPTILVSWESNTAVTSVVSMFPENNPEGLREEVNLELIAGEHQMIIRGLLPDTIYSLTVKGSDVLGNQASSTAQRLTTATDTRPPAITNLRVETSKGTVNDSAQLIVTWTTDEPTTTQVEYGEGTGDSYGQRSQLDSNLTLNHTVVISGLTPGKVYHLRALVTDDADNTTESLDYVAITPKAGNTAIELVINSLSKVFGFLR